MTWDEIQALLLGSVWGVIFLGALGSAAFHYGRKHWTKTGKAKEKYYKEQAKLVATDPELLHGYLLMGVNTVGYAIMLFLITMFVIMPPLEWLGEKVGTGSWIYKIMQLFQLIVFSRSIVFFLDFKDWYRISTDGWNMRTKPKLQENGNTENR